MLWYILFGAAVGGLVGYLVYRATKRWKDRSSHMPPVECHVRESNPDWMKYKMEDPASGDMIPVDYDPDRDGEFTGDPGMIPALAAIQLGGAVMMNRLDDGSWEIIGPEGVRGEGKTPSEAYGKILKRIEQDLN